MTQTPALSTNGGTSESGVRRVHPAQIDVDDVDRTDTDTRARGRIEAPVTLAPRNAVEHARSDDDNFDDFDDLDIELVVFDMAGTTVRDDGLVERAFVLAAESSGIAATEAARRESLNYVRETMGQSKIEVFRELTDNESEAIAANAAFEAAYGELIAQVGVRAIDGAEAVFRELRDAGVKVVLTTGFSRRTQDALIDALGWADLIDLSLCPSEAGRGRPYPDLPLTALLRTGASGVAAMVVVGDTASDMLSGASAGAGLVAGVRSGAHDSEMLEAAGADVVIDSVAHLAELLGLRAELIRRS